MIISDSFVQATKARDIEFTTSHGMCYFTNMVSRIGIMQFLLFLDDYPLIVQFAAHNASDFALASELVAK